MRKTEMELLAAYLFNSQLRIENEYMELKNRVRFRHISIEDNVEMMLTMQRLQDFKEFSDDVRAILHL